MEKFDLKSAFKSLYAPKATDFVEVEVPTFNYVMVDGAGNPNTAQEYVDAVEALYSTAYTAKFASKKAGSDFTVGPLEGLWFSDDPSVFVAGDKDSWRWTMMIALPPFISADDVASAKQAAAAKKDLPSLGKLRFESLTEGRCLQIMHMGSYDDEAPTLARLHDELMPSLGLTFNGPHHEIYLSDPRRVEPAKLKTVLRQPVRPA